MKTHYLKSIGTFPAIRIAVPALRIKERAQMSPQTTPPSREDLMSVYRQDLAMVIERRPCGRICSRAA